MTKSEYLKKLRWDENKFMVLTAEECSTLLNVPGAVNQMFKIGEPSAKASFGAGAMVVNIAWANQHLSSAPVEEPKPVATTPPPVPNAPAKEVSAPPLPTPPPVPEKLQEIAKESPNVVIASIPNPEAPSNNNVEARIAWLEKAGLTVDREKQTITDDEGEVTEFKDLEGISEEDWMGVTVYYSPKNIRDRKEANKTVEAPVEEAPIVEEEVQDEPEVDEEAEALAEFEATQKAKEEADKISKEKSKAEAELTEQTKFRRIALQAIGWKEAKTPGYIIGPKSSLRYQEILDMPEAEFKQLLAQEVEQKETPKKTTDEPLVDTEALQAAKKAIEEELTGEAHHKKVMGIKKTLEESKTEKAETKEGIQKDIKPRIESGEVLPGGADRSREMNARELLGLLIANGQASRPAKELAKYAYDLVDEMSKLAKK